VLVSWPASKGGATPDHYLVLRDGKQVGAVPASRTSFTDSGLAPGSKHRYRIVAESGGQKSSPSVKEAAVTTITPSPVGLTLSKATWTTVTLRWSPSSLGPVPDKYQIYSGGSLVGIVGGSADSYVATGLTAGGSYKYQVDAVWGQAVSALSAPLTALTLAPPLNGSVSVNLDTTSTPGSGASLSVGDHWSDTWQFAPACVSTGCTLTADAELAAPGFAAKQFTMKLHGSGRSFGGSAKAQISSCGSVDVTNTITLSISAKGAVTNGAWDTWTGTMQVSSPYTTVGNEYCPTQSWSFSIKGP
jgi:Fibronectin type III domain